MFPDVKCEIRVSGIYFCPHFGSALRLEDPPIRPQSKVVDADMRGRSYGMSYLVGVER